MGLYTFEVDVLAVGNVTVEANSYEEAEEKAKNAGRSAEELEGRSVEYVVALIEGPDDE